METTGNYHAPVAKLLHDAGLYVSVVNAKLVHGYGNNDLRRVKTDKKDAVKLANYGLDRWLTLPRYVPEEDTRLLLKNCYRQYRQYSKVQTVLKNNLISLLDTVFPNVNRLFSSPIRGDGSEKWVDFVAEFWHCRCVSEKSEKAFTSKYLRWCRKHGYNFREAKAHTIYAEASGHIDVMPKSETTKLLVEQGCVPAQGNLCCLERSQTRNAHLSRTTARISCRHGYVWRGTYARSTAHSRNWRCAPFYSKKALVAYAGLDAPPNDSGDVTGRHKSMSKIGASSLRRTLFLVMSVYLQNAPLDEPVYQFMDRKRAEGKPYRVYMMASAKQVPADLLRHCESLSGVVGAQSDLSIKRWLAAVSNLRREAAWFCAAFCTLHYLEIST